MAIFGEGKKRKRDNVREKKKGREREREREMKNKFKDDIRSLDGLKTKRQSMQKLKESR